MKSLRQEVYRYVRERYGSEIETLWARFPNYVVFRHADNRKWYGAIMDIPRSRLGLPGDAKVDVLNLKMDSPLLVDLLTQEKGIFPGCHISRGNWISVLLDGSVAMEEICAMIDKSYQVTGPRAKGGAHPAIRRIR